MAPNCIRNFSGRHRSNLVNNLRQKTGQFANLLHKQSCFCVQFSPIDFSTRNCFQFLSRLKTRAGFILAYGHFAVTISAIGSFSNDEGNGKENGI